MELFVETSTEITNKHQLVFQEHKTKELISKQIHLEYGVGDILTIITLLIALGAMTLSFASSDSSSLKGYRLTVVVVILLGCLGYAGYAQYKISEDRKTIQTQIEKTLYAIDVYEQKNKQGKI